MASNLVISPVSAGIIEFNDEAKRPIDNTIFTLLGQQVLKALDATLNDQYEKYLNENGGMCHKDNLSAL